MQAGGDVVGKMRTTDRNYTGITGCAIVKYRDIGRTTTDFKQTTPISRSSGLKLRPRWQYVVRAHRVRLDRSDSHT
jgi:hypothetical protein